MQSLRSEVRERATFEHQILATDGDLYASFQYEHEVIYRFALLVYDAGRIRLESFFVFHLYVEYHVLFQKTHQNRFRDHVCFESFDTYKSKGLQPDHIDEDLTTIRSHGN